MPKVLLADDDASLLMLMQQAFKAKHYEVVTAMDGIDALEKVRSENPDIAIIDALMPKLSGYDCLNEIRKLGGKASKIPIVAMSAKKSMESFFDSANIHGFFVKPVDINEVLVHVEEVLKHEGSVVVPVKQEEDSEKTTVKSVPEKKEDAPPVEEESLPEPPAPVRKSNENRQSVIDDPEDRKGDEHAWWSDKMQLHPDNKKVILAGFQDFLLKKVEGFLKNIGYEVYRCRTEEETLRKAEEVIPLFILSQFWDDAAHYDAEKIYKGIRQKRLTRDILFMAFCYEGWEPLVVRLFTKYNSFTYSDVGDLKIKLEDFFKPHVPPPAK